MLAVQMEEVHYTGFICKLLETKIMQVLRFKHGQVRDIESATFRFVRITLAILCLHNNRLNAIP